MAHNSARLLRRLNPFCAQALTAAASLCQSRGHALISIEHWLLKLLEQGHGDLNVIAQRYAWDLDALWQGLLDYFDTLPCSVRSKPRLSSELQQLITNAWLRASLEDDSDTLRSAHLLGALLEAPSLLKCTAAWPLLSISVTQLQQLAPALDQASDERPDAEALLIEKPGASGNAGADQAPTQDLARRTVLERFTQDITGKAAAGQIDPVYGRDDEIRQVIDILSRRRKNNPILVGEPGVGKTALVEGLALRIAKGEVPDSLKPVSVRTLDLGLLQAGAGLKGEFEQRLKSVIDAVQQSSTPVSPLCRHHDRWLSAPGTAGKCAPGAGAREGASVAEVALQHGFSNARRFAQYFQQAFGVSPAEIRRGG